MTAFTATLQGVTIGDGTAYPFAEPPDGFGTPPIRVGDINLPRRDGVIAGDDRFAARHVMFDVHVLGLTESGGADTETLANTLKAAFARSGEGVDVPLTWTVAGQAYTLYGRPSGCEVILVELKHGGAARARCEFRATNPVLLGDETTTVVALATGGGGLVIPAVVPFALGASSGGETTLNDAGTYEVEWTASLAGPLTNPRLEHVTKAQALAFTGDIAAGETLELDSRARSVLLNGTASRYSWLSSSSRWFTLSPGLNTIRFTAGGGTGSATFRHRPGWI